MATVEEQAITKQPVSEGQWTWSNQNSVPPGTKQIRSSTGDWANATELYITTIDNNNADRTQGLSALRYGDLIHLEVSNDASVWAEFTVTNNSVNRTDYFMVPVTPTAQQGVAPNNNAQVNATGTPSDQPDPAYSPNPGYLSMMIQMQPNITEEIAPDLISYLFEYLETVTHLVNYASAKANIAGVIIANEQPVLPASVGDLVPPPAE